MGQQRRPDLGRPAFPQARSMTAGNYVPQARSMTSGNYVPQARSMTAGNYVPQVANSSSSRNFEGSDPIYLDMANLSLNDYQNQIPTHLSPTSDRQVGLNPTDQMGSSAYPSTSDMRSPHYNTVQQGSHGLTLPTVDPNSDRTREDRSVHRTNINSFNENNDTVRDSYNDNSLVDTTGRYSGHGNVLFHDIPIFN